LVDVGGGEVLDEEGGGNIASDNCDVLDPKTPQLQPDNNNGEGEDPGDEDKGGGDVIGGTMKVDGDEGGGDVDGDKIDEMKIVGKTPTEEDGGVGGVASGGWGVETDKTPNPLPVNTCLTTSTPPGEGGDSAAGGDRGVEHDETPDSLPVNTFIHRSPPPPSKAAQPAPPAEEDSGVGGVASGGRGVETDKTPNPLPVNTCKTSAVPPGEGGDRVAGGDRGVDTPVNTFNPRSTPPSPLSLRGAAPPTPACESSPKSRRPHSRLGASS
jgi:hypothetical protein